MSDPDAQWHLDKKVPIALILALVMQTVAAVWWASGVNTRVEMLEQRTMATAPQADRLTRVEVKVESIQQGVERIERLITREAGPQR